MTTPAEIARSLSDAQRRALLSINPQTSGRIRWATDRGSIRECGGRKPPTIRALMDKELAWGLAGSHWLLPLGLQVRQILEERNDAG